MGYTTKDLSTILNVTTNTVRRYEEKGFLSATRNESNGYRQFAPLDVEKLMYVSKYRKIGFSQDEISEIFEDSIPMMIDRFEKKMASLDAEIERLKSLRHLVKDDMVIMKTAQEYGDTITEGYCAPMNYIVYAVKGEMNLGKEHREALHKYMNTCPEFEYMYLFSKPDIENGDYTYSEGITANELITNKYNVNVDEPVKYYKKCPCLLRFVKVPLDFGNSKNIDKQLLEKTMFGDIFDYMKEHNMKLAGDVLGLKLCLSREEDKDWQYILMHFPVE